jgi:hypothetical protein
MQEARRRSISGTIQNVTYEPVRDVGGVEMIGFFTVLETEAADRGGVIAVAKCKLEGLFKTQARRRRMDRSRRNMKESSRFVCETMADKK